MSALIPSSAFSEKTKILKPKSLNFLCLAGCKSPNLYPFKPSRSSNFEILNLLLIKTTGVSLTHQLTPYYQTHQE